MQQATETTAPQAMTQTTKEKVRQIVARIEKLNEERAAVTKEINEAYAEAKGFGFMTAALRKVVAWRAKDRNKADEEETWQDLFKQALGHI